MKTRLQAWARAIGTWLIVWGTPPDVETDAQRRDREMRSFQQYVTTQVDVILDVAIDCRAALGAQDLAIRRTMGWIGPDALDEPAPVETPTPERLLDSETLALLSPDGQLEYEVSWHRKVPAFFSHGGAVYHRRHERGATAWEFVR